MTLQTHNLRCVRQSNILFAGLSFTLHSGEIMLVEGTNGSGKSSLLRLLVGLSTPDEGEVLWHGQSIANVREEFVKHLHYVGHANGVKLGLTVEENLQLASVIGMTAPRNDENSMFGLIPHLHTQAKHLSAGQQRKIALVKLITFPKQLWILDEPITALDTPSQAVFLSHLENHLANGGSCVMSSHHAIQFQHIKPIIVRLPI